MLSELKYNCKYESESCSVMSDSLQLHGLYSPWNSPGQNTGVGSLSLLQGIFPTQGSYPGLPHCRWILYQLSHKGSLRILDWGAYPFSSRSSWSWNRRRVSWLQVESLPNWAIREANCKYGWIYSNMYGPVRSLFLPGSSVTVSTVVCTSECGTKQMPIIDPHHGWLNGKESVCLKAGDVCLILWSEDSLENKMAFRHSCQEKSVDRQHWWDTVHGVSKVLDNT